MNRLKLNLVIILGIMLVMISGVSATLYVNSGCANERDSIVDAANRLVETQNEDGGWEWVNPDENPSTGVPSPKNTVGVTAQGLLDVYRLTKDYRYLNSSISAYRYIDVQAKNDERIRGPDIPFLVELSEVTGEAEYAELAKTRYQDALEEYGGATGLAEHIRDVRVSQGWETLVPWDINLYVQGALALNRYYPEERFDNDAEDMTEIIYNYLYVDESGFDFNDKEQDAYWLAYTGAIEAFTTTGLHLSERDSLKEDLLENQGIEGDFDNDPQITAYAVMALLKAGEKSAAENGVMFLMNTQDENGGWSYDENEYTEVTSESTQAIFDSIYENAFCSIQDAIDAANSGDVIEVSAGTYEEGLIDINKDLTIIGDAENKPVFKPTEDTIHSNHRGWIQVSGDVNVIIKNLILDGEGKNIENAIRYQDDASGSVENCDFLNIKYNQYTGIGVVVLDYSKYLGGELEDISPEFYVKDCTFENIQRIGMMCFGVDKCYFENNKYLGKGEGDWLDYGIEIGGGAQATLSGNEISNCNGVAESDGSISAGILVTTYYGEGTSAEIQNNVLYDNTVGIAVGYDEEDSSNVVINNNNEIYNNEYGIETSESGLIFLAVNENSIYDNSVLSLNANNGPEVNAEKNWWGSAIFNEIKALITGLVDFDPWYLSGDMVHTSDEDSDGDTVIDSEDNCVDVANADQADSDSVIRQIAIVMV